MKVISKEERIILKQDIYTIECSFMDARMIFWGLKQMLENMKEKSWGVAYWDQVEDMVKHLREKGID